LFLGLPFDPNFFRWQMGDFLGATMIAVVLEVGISAALSYYKKYIGKSFVGRAMNLVGNHRKLLAASVTFSVLLLYEIQEMSAHGLFDYKDMVAYTAGIAMYLSIEWIWRKYLLAKVTGIGKLRTIFKRH
jgi:hypothetical protein